MSSQNDHGFRTFVAGGAIPAHRRVKLDATVNQVVLAGAADDSIGTTGVTTGDIVAGDPVTVKLHNAPGTHKGEANEAIALHAVVYGGADGKFSATDPTGTSERWIALQATTADGDIVEYLRTVH
jgi:hypothetical protein